MALLFETPSLRTRLGFATAALRLGGSWVDVEPGEHRIGVSFSEPRSDVVRLASGMADLLVYRGRTWAVEIAAVSASPVINAGDDREHPTQALVDLITIERYVGPIDELRIGICGDLGSRCATSLIRLLGRIRPRSLALCGPESRRSLSMALDADLAARVFQVDRLQPEELDAIYLPGLPEGQGEDRLAAETRGRYQITSELMARLPSHGAVVSPMPVIDEISDEARRDPRVRLFEATDGSVAIRMKVLALLASPAACP